MAGGPEVTADESIDEVLTVREVAEALKISEKSVREFLQTNKIAGVKIGRAWRVRRSEVDRILREGV